MAEVLTCATTLEEPGRCCAAPEFVVCGRDAAYAVLLGSPDGPPTEHLRCVDHAAQDRELADDLLAAKTYHPRAGYAAGRPA